MSTRTIVTVELPIEQAMLLLSFLDTGLDGIDNAPSMTAFKPLMEGAKIRIQDAINKQ